MKQTQETLARLNPANIVATAQLCLANSSYRPLQTVACRYREGVLTLQGQVPTFFHKQLAQEAIRKVKGVRKIDNQIDVRS
jgi:osmotically-inducible protein OsmY